MHPTRSRQPGKRSLDSSTHLNCLNTRLRLHRRSIPKTNSDSGLGLVQRVYAMAEQYDIITFDCYGTLIDWESGIISAFQSEAAKDGVELRGDQIIEAYAAEEPSVEFAAYRSYR